MRRTLTLTLTLALTATSISACGFHIPDPLAPSKPVLTYWYEMDDSNMLHPVPMDAEFYRRQQKYFLYQAGMLPNNGYPYHYPPYAHTTLSGLEDHPKHPSRPNCVYSADRKYEICHYVDKNGVAEQQ
jgi:hypothetical protein